MYGLSLSATLRSQKRVIGGPGFWDLGKGIAAAAFLSFGTLYFMFHWREGNIPDASRILAEKLESSFQLNGKVAHEIIPSNIEETPATNTSMSMEQIQNWVNSSAARYNVSPKLVMAIIAERSNFEPDLISSRGEVGLMQLMPLILQQYGLSSDLSPEQNIDRGTCYLSEMLARYHGDEQKAVAAFLTGPAWVDYYSGLPADSETSAIVEHIFARLH